MAAYRMTSARRAALRKAQLASARKRKGRGKGKRRIMRNAAVIAASVAAAGGTAYVYKNREKMIVAPLAERSAMWVAKRKKGSKLTKTEIHRVRKIERDLHARRSVRKVQQYKQAKAAYSAGIPMTKTGKANYRKYVKVRAISRLRRIKGQKAKPFSYDSGKVRFITKKGTLVRLPF